MLEKVTLKSGLRLLLYPMQNTKAITLLVLVASGSKYETRNINGISHFLEHTIFKGTKRRPTTLDIAKELDGVGGAYNAFTGKEVMGFWVKVNEKHFRLAADVISDILFNSLFKAEELEKEKKVIFEEINMIEDDPQHYVLELWERLLYGEQPAGWMISGSKETVAHISREDIIRYFKRCFFAENAVISLAGNFANRKAIPEIEKFFNKFGKTKALSKKITIERQVSPQVLLHFKETGQTHLCLGVRAFDLFSPKRYVLEIISAILGGSMSARLSVEVRQKRGLAYYVTTSLGQYTDTGYLVTEAGVDTKRVDEAIKIILKEYQKLKTKKITQSELNKVKDNIKGRLALSLETSDAWAAYWGEQEVLKRRVLTPEEECAKIDKVGFNDIQRVSREIFKKEKLNLALIGSFKEKERFEKLLNILA